MSATEDGVPYLRFTHSLQGLETNTCTSRKVEVTAIWQICALWKIWESYLADADGCIVEAVLMVAVGALVAARSRVLPVLQQHLLNYYLGLTIVYTMDEGEGDKTPS